MKHDKPEVSAEENKPRKKFVNVHDLALAIGHVQGVREVASQDAEDAKRIHVPPPRFA